LVLHFSDPGLRSNGELTRSTTQLVLRGTLDDGRRIAATVSILDK
jgi:hypothetical protein